MDSKNTTKINLFQLVMLALGSLDHSLDQDGCLVPGKHPELPDPPQLFPGLLVAWSLVR